MSITLVTPAQEEPVTLAEAKSYLRLDGTDSDSLVTHEIAAARQICERITGLRLITQTIEARFDDWPSGQSSTWWSGVKDGVRDDLRPSLPAMPLPVGPIQSLLGIDLIDDDDVTTTVTPTPAYVTSGLMPLLVLKTGQSWPTPLRARNGIAVRLVVGFGAAASVPFAIREGILQLVAHRFDNPTSAEIPKGVKTLWSSYRRVGL